MPFYPTPGLTFGNPNIHRCGAPLSQFVGLAPENLSSLYTATPKKSGLPKSNSFPSNVFTLKVWDLDGKAIS